MKKRIISLVLTLVMVLGMIPAASAANHPFTDVPDNAWYAEYVAYCYEHGLMAGNSATKFDPEATMTRAMTVTVLYRLAGAPEVDAANPFKDVPSGKWFTDPVLWAANNKITAGTSATKFSPNEYVTREQLVTFLYRYAQTLGIELTTDSLSKFIDAGSVAKYAKTPFAWAVENGIISGTSATRLSPKQTATRAQCATILARFDQWVNGYEDDPAPSEPTDPSVCEHEYESEVFESSWGNEGYTLHTCKICGDYFKSDFTSALPNQEDERKIASLVAQYVNQFREEEGSGECEVLPKMTLVAEYRAVQITTNYAHDTYDTREAHAYYEYGEYVEMSDPANNYWRSWAAEAIGRAGVDMEESYEEIAFRIATSYRESESHWAYLSDDIYFYIAVGVKYSEGEWFSCVMINDRNYG